MLRARLTTLTALVGLLAAAAGVVLVLPRAVDEAAVKRPVAGPAPGAVRQAMQAPVLTPAVEAESGAREAAQARLGEVLRLQARLDASRVSVWGGDDYAAAVSALAIGDEAFRSGDFDTAHGAYDHASVLMQRVEEGKAQRFDAVLRDGARALDLQETSTALAAFRLAVAMDPSSDKAVSGLARAGTLQQVLDFYRRALEAEEVGELGQAQSLLQQAVALDGAFVDGSAALERVGSRIEERDFGAAMSAALTALSAGDRRAARTALSRASALRPSDASVADARRRLALADEHARIQELKREALAREGEERWREAGVAYERVLEIDPQAAFARRGLVRSNEQQRINDRVDAYLQTPQLLEADEPLHDARLLLEAAYTGEAPGPGLAAKLERLDAMVRDALIPVTVVVQSDGATRVSILRVVRLGLVTRHTLALRPGGYVATGSRPGFRDVRVAFEVPAGKDSVTVTVVCKEPV